MRNLHLGGDVHKKVYGDHEPRIRELEKLASLGGSGVPDAIRFNQLNNGSDTLAGEADYLAIDINGTGGQTGSFVHVVAYSLVNNTTVGGMEEVNNTDGIMAWVDTGNGAKQSTGGSRTRYASAGGDYLRVGQWMVEDGVGVQWFQNNGSATIFENTVGGITFLTSGSDPNDVGMKFNITSYDFLIEFDEDVVLTTYSGGIDTSGQIDSTTPKSPFLRISPYFVGPDWSAQYYFYELPSGDPGLSKALYVDGSGFVKQSP